MKTLSRAVIVTALALVPTVSHGQAAPAGLREEILMHFNESISKVIALAEAMPADKFTWSPGTGVMPVGQVYMHIAHYNYGYPSQNMGVPAPAGVNLDKMEEVRDKAAVVKALRESAEYVKKAVATADLTKATRLYGRDVQQWAVLMQLVAHMNEHLGQSIAYARMNSIVPPWSR